ncbi:SGNH/GDSL hydrolase family protein [uncultured Reyranella sp.]|uniref:SGNH/GDSL hydrolase family protein n=1 Tax=uncultured Reyranella sp. TaxID=735512 RepID=UPI0025CED6D0|nr:SGNH/GDSL hydrolase family protein [uncultured Reyranella sp.]
MSVETSPQMPRVETGRKRRSVLSAVAILAGLAVGIGLAEGLTRLLLPAFDPSGRFEFTYPVGSLVLGKPGLEARQVKNTGDYDVAIRINSHGLRDANDVATAGSDDILVVGDSFTWGWGVEAQDRFSEQLQILTGRRTFNLSTPTDIDGYAALLDYARKLGSRAGRVVIAICMENDLHLYGSDPPEEPPPDNGDTLKDWLSSHSALYLFAVTAVQQTPWLRDIAVKAGLIVPNLEGIAKNDYDPAAIDSSADRLQQIAEQYRTLVVLIPSRALWVGNSHSQAIENRVHTAFVVALQRRGIDVLDLQPVLEAQLAPLSYHFANDGHWNARGHALAAQAISQHLAR